MARIIVFSARRYKFDDKDTGRPVSGMKALCSVVGVEPKQDDQNVGLDLVEQAFPYAQWSHFADVRFPAVYNCEFVPGPGARGKATTIIADLRFSHSIDLLLEVPKLAVPVAAGNGAN
jgi:hypothetical protein